MADAFHLSDGTRSVDAPTLPLATAALSFCQTNNVNSNAQRDTVLAGATQAQLNQFLIGLIKGLVQVGPP